MAAATSASGDFRLAGRRVLVTGANGFIGGRIVDHLASRGVEIIAVSRRHRDTTHGSVIRRQADLLDPRATLRLLKSTQPDIVFHLSSRVAGARDAALVLPTMQHNLCGAVNLMSAALEVTSARVVLAGSMEEPGASADPGGPSSPYAVAKWAATGYAQMFYALWALPVTVLRIAMVYGPGQLDVSRLVPYVILSLSQQRSPLLTSGDRGIDWVHVDDVLDAFLAAALAPEAPGKVIEIGSGTSVTIRETVQLIRSLMSSSVQPEFGALPDRKLDVARIADLGSAAAVLDWHPQVRLEDGMKSTISWYADQLARGRLPPSR